MDCVLWQSHIMYCLHASLIAAKSRLPSQLLNAEARDFYNSAVNCNDAYAAKHDTDATMLQEALTLCWELASICGRVHGSKQAEVRMALQRVRVPTLVESDAAAGALQQPCYTLQRLCTAEPISGCDAERSEQMNYALHLQTPSQLLITPEIFDFWWTGS